MPENRRLRKDVLVASKDSQNLDPFLGFDDGKSHTFQRVKFESPLQILVAIHPYRDSGRATHISPLFGQSNRARPLNCPLQCTPEWK